MMGITFVKKLMVAEQGGLDIRNTIDNPVQNKPACFSPSQICLRYEKIVNECDQRIV